MCIFGEERVLIGGHVLVMGFDFCLLFLRPFSVIFLGNTQAPHVWNNLVPHDFLAVEIRQKLPMLQGSGQ